MLSAPGQDKWKTSKLSEKRRHYLDVGRSFESIAALIFAQLEITKYWIKPLETPPKTPGFPKDFQQACFRLHVSNEAFDLFHNVPDGLRGRYWQTQTSAFWQRAT